MVVRKRASSNLHRDGGQSRARSGGGTPKTLELTRAASVATTTTNPVSAQKPKLNVKIEGNIRFPAADGGTTRRSSNKPAAPNKTVETLPESLREPNRPADEAERPQEPARLPRITFLESEELTRELLHGPLSFDSISRLGLRVKKLAKNHNLSVQNAEFLKHFDEDSDATTLTPESGEDEEASPSPSPTSVFTPYAFSDIGEYSGEYPDHVDFRASYVSLAADALDTPAPQPEVSLSASKSKPRLHKKNTIGQISDAYGSLEEIETALNEALKIQNSANTICESLEAEMNARIDSAEALLVQKGLADGPSPSTLPQSVLALSVIPRPSSREYKGGRPYPPSSSGGKCAALKDSRDQDQDDIIKHIRNEKSMGNLRWEAAMARGGAKLWLQTGLSGGHQAN